MIIKWVEWDFFCDVCQALVTHDDDQPELSAAIEDLRDEIYGPEKSLKGWIIKGDSVICEKCKKNPIKTCDKCKKNPNEDGIKNGRI